MKGDSTFVKPVGFWIRLSQLEMTSKAFCEFCANPKTREHQRQLPAELVKVMLLATIFLLECYNDGVLSLDWAPEMSVSQGGLISSPNHASGVNIDNAFSAGSNKGKVGVRC